MAASAVMLEEEKSPENIFRKRHDVKPEAQTAGGRKKEKEGEIPVYPVKKREPGVCQSGKKRSTSSSVGGRGEEGKGMWPRADDVGGKERARCSSLQEERDGSLKEGRVSIPQKKLGKKGKGPALHGRAIEYKKNITNVAEKKREGRGSTSEKAASVARKRQYAFATWRNRGGRGEDVAITIPPPQNA